MIEKGDRVVLTTERHGISRANPVYGTNYFCEGTVYYASNVITKVKWDSGSRNVYSAKDLQVVGRPSSAYKGNAVCNSIW